MRSTAAAAPMLIPVPEVGLGVAEEDEELDEDDQAQPEPIHGTLIGTPKSGAPSARKGSKAKSARTFIVIVVVEMIGIESEMRTKKVGI